MLQPRLHVLFRHIVNILGRISSHSKYTRSFSKYARARGNYARALTFENLCEVGSAISSL